MRCEYSQRCGEYYDNGLRCNCFAFRCKIYRERRFEEKQEDERAMREAQRKRLEHVEKFVWGEDDKKRVVIKRE